MEDDECSEDGWAAVSAHALGGPPASSDGNSNTNALPASDTILQTPTPSIFDSQIGNDDGDDDGAGWEGVADADNESEMLSVRSFQTPSVKSIGSTSTRRLGRPPGLKGSHSFRAKLRAEREAEAAAAQSNMSRSDICKLAREKKAQKRAAKDEEIEDRKVQRLKADALALVPLAVDAHPQLGADLEKSVCSCALQALQRPDISQMLVKPAYSSTRLKTDLDPGAYISFLFHGTSDNSAQSDFPEVKEEDNSFADMIGHVFKPYRSICSSSRDAEAFKVSDQTMARTIIRSACAVKCASSKLWGNFLQHLKTMMERYNGVLFVVAFRFDETPSKIKIQDIDSQYLSNFSSGAGKSTQAAKQLAKVLQTELCVSALLAPKSRDLPQESMLISGYVPVPLQVLDRQTARNMRQALRDSMHLPGLDEVASEFKKKLFLYCTDEFAANGLTQFAMQASHPGWMQVATLCDIHKSSTCQGRVFDLSGPAISAVINLALSMTAAGSVGRMQTMLGNIITDRFEYKVGIPQLSPEALAYKMSVLDLFLGVPEVFAVQTSDAVSSKQRLRYTQRQQQRLIILQFLQDDFRETKSITMWAKPGEYQSPEDALQTMLRFLVPALLPSSCPLFPRSRWVGADCALDFVGLLASVRNLLIPLVGMWCGKDIEQNLPDLPHGNEGNDAAALEDDEIGWSVHVQDEQSAPAPAAPVLPPDAAMGEEGEEAQQDAQPDPEADAPAADGFDWHQYHQKLKTSVADWLKTSVQGQGPSASTQLALMRQYMQPVLKWTTFLLHVSSKRWTREQLAKEALGQQRSYRMVLALKGAEERKALEQILVLLVSPLVGIIEMDWRHDINTIAFCQLSRLGCCLHQLLVWRHRRYPYALRLGCAFHF
eukprot:Skav222977  [mRNA]  locus=scaffold2762:20868:23516:+ [translate_table: standard]